jgi:microcystin-dependent protein
MVLSTGTVPSADWLEADGSAVSRTTYSDLFTAIGTKYGPGDGSTTFNLPSPDPVFTGSSDQLSAYETEVLADSPYLYWESQDASGHLADASGNSRDTTTESVLTYQVGGPFFASLAIEKGNGGAAYRTSASAATNNFTAEFWLYLVSGGGGNRTIFANHNGGAGWDIYMPASNKFAVVVQSVGFMSQCAATLATATWYHVVVTRDSGTWKYYVNGAVDTSNAGTGAPSSASGGTIGIDSAASALDIRFAHVAYYESALSSARVAAHYAAAFGDIFDPWLIHV